MRVGFDEAGLGPTLGPLVVAGFATRCRAGPDQVGASQPRPSDDLRGPLAELVAGPGARDGRLEVGDSKKIHAGPRKLARIERTALATVAWVHGELPGSVAELLARVGVDAFEQPSCDRRAPWWSALDEALPIAHERGEIEELAGSLRELATARGVEALWYRADLISAARVNRELAAEQLREGGSKNTWATHAVLRLARLAGEELGRASSLAIWCDKAGGRQAYLEPICRAFPQLEGVGAAPRAGTLELFGPAASLERIEEQRERSCYRIGLGTRNIELGFVMGGDRCDPRISWASILAKYLRELILRAFNRYFAGRVPGIRRTAGYPEDARRFVREVEAALGDELGLEREVWIRAK